eukprot:3933059-Lingulodinium_polyedra.AAC.1
MSVLACQPESVRRPRPGKEAQAQDRGLRHPRLPRPGASASPRGRSQCPWRHLHTLCSAFLADTLWRQRPLQRPRAQRAPARCQAC